MDRDTNDNMQHLGNEIVVPEYVRKFDENKSFLHFTEEEIASLMLCEQSIIKNTRINKFRALIQFDYRNFIHSEQGNTIISNLNDIENISCLDIPNTSNSVYMLFFQLLKQSMLDIENSESRPGKDGIITLMTIEEKCKERLYKRFCYNLYKHWRDNNVEYLTPFFISHSNGYIKTSYLTLANDNFVIDLAKFFSLHSDGYRKEVYQSLLVLCMVHDLTVSGRHTILDKLFSMYENKLKKTARNETNFQQFTINWEEEEQLERLASLRGQDPRSNEEKNKVIREIQDHYRNLTIRDSFISDEMNYMKSLLRTEFHRLDPNIATADEWSYVYSRLKTKWTKNKVSIDSTDVKTITPPDCYVLYLLAYEDPIKIIDFDTEQSQEVIEDILYLIYIKEGKGVPRLLKVIYILNFIKNKIGEVISPTVNDFNTEKQAIERAISFIRIIFTDQYRIDKVSQQELCHLFKEILSYKEVTRTLPERLPRGFVGNFNLLMTCAIIGLLKELGYFGTSIRKLDEAISRDNNLFNEKTQAFKSHRKYIENWKDTIDKEFRKYLEHKYKL